jgi:hypothetical protein
MTVIMRNLTDLFPCPGSFARPPQFPCDPAGAASPIATKPAREGGGFVAIVSDARTAWAGRSGW